MLAPLSMIATVTAFSLFTAYQFLSSDMCIDTPESKMRPSPSCVYQRFVAWWWKWSRRAFSLLTAYQILSADLYFQEVLTTAWIRVKIQHLPKEEHRGSLICAAKFYDHMFIISRYEFDHICRSVRFFSVFYIFLLCRRIKFRALLPPENKTTWLSFYTRIWPHLWP